MSPGRGVSPLSLKSWSRQAASNLYRRELERAVSSFSQERKKTALTSKKLPRYSSQKSNLEFSFCTISQAFIKCNIAAHVIINVVSEKEQISNQLRETLYSMEIARY